jgi:Primase C terminal 2 (PriCT-2)
MNADMLVLPDALMARRFLQGIYAGAPAGLFAAVRMLRVREENLAPFASSVCAPAKAAEQAAQFVLEQLAHDVDLGIHHSLSLFDAGGTASINVAWRGVLSVELDLDPTGGLAKAEALIGPANWVVRSGGTWASPDGEVVDRLHAYWRLAEPITAAGDDRLRCAQVQHWLTELASGDPGNKNLAALLRTPGSLWLKQGRVAARLCRVITERMEPAVDLARIYPLLEQAVIAKRAAEPERWGRGKKRIYLAGGAYGEPGQGEVADDPYDIVAAMLVIPNPETTDAAADWERFNTFGMACWRAAGGTDADEAVLEIGWQAWLAWCEKYPHHDEDHAFARWVHFSTSPPDTVGFQTLRYWAQQAVPGWQSISWGRRNAKLVAAALKATGAAREALRAALQAQPAFQSFGAVASEAELDAAWSAEPFSTVVDDVEEGPSEGKATRELVHYTPDNSLADVYWPLFDRALAANPDIYQASGQWVAVNPHADPDSILPAVQTMNEADIHTEVDRHYEFYKLKAPKGKAGGPATLVPIFQPVELTRNYHRLQKRAPMGRILRGLATVPNIRPDGTFGPSAGYDADTGVLHVGCPDLVVPAHPSKDEAHAAHQALVAPWQHFLWQDDVEGPAWLLGQLLTLARRPWLSKAPMFMLSAAQPQSGKDLLQETSAFLVLGQLPRKATWVQDDNQRMTEAHLVAVTRDNPHTVLFSNANDVELTSNYLEDLIMSEAPKVAREYGTHNLIVTLNRIMLMINGNHLRGAADMVFRLIRSELNPRCENPQLRSFPFSVWERVKAERHQLLGALFTLLRAHRLAGAPGPGTPCNFSDWGWEVRDPVWWLTGIDLLAGQQLERASDTVVLQNGAVLRFLAETFVLSTEPIGAADVAQRVNALTVDAPVDKETREYHELLFTAFSKRHGEPIRYQAATKVLKRLLDARQDGLWLEERRVSHLEASRYFINRKV